MFTNNTDLELNYYKNYEDFYHPKFWGDNRTTKLQAPFIPDRKKPKEEEEEKEEPIKQPVNVKIPIAKSTSKPTITKIPTIYNEKVNLTHEPEIDDGLNKGTIKSSNSKQNFNDNQKEHPGFLNNDIIEVKNIYPLPDDYFKYKDKLEIPSFEENDGIAKIKAPDIFENYSNKIEYPVKVNPQIEEEDDVTEIKIPDSKFEYPIELNPQTQIHPEPDVNAENNNINDDDDGDDNDNGDENPGDNFDNDEEIPDIYINSSEIKLPLPDKQFEDLLKQISELEKVVKAYESINSFKNVQNYGPAIFTPNEPYAFIKSEQLQTPVPDKHIQSILNELNKKLETQNKMIADKESSLKTEMMLVNQRNLDLKSAKSEIEILRENFKITKDNNRVVNDRLNKIKNKLLRSKTNLNNLKDSSYTQLKIINNLEHEIGNRNEVNQLFEIENQKLKEELYSLQNDSTKKELEFENKLKKLETKIKELNDYSVSKENLSNKLQEQIRRGEVESQQLDMNLKKLKDEYKVSKIIEISANKTIADLTNDLNNNNSKMSDLFNEIEAYKEKNEQYKTSIGQLESELKNALLAKETALSDLSSNSTTLEHFNEVQSKTKFLESEINNLKEKLRVKQNSYINSLRDLDDLRNRFDVYKENSSNKISNLKNIVKQKELNGKLLEDDTKNLVSKVHSLEFKLRETSAELNEKKKNINDLTKRDEYRYFEKIMNKKRKHFTLKQDKESEIYKPFTDKIEKLTTENNLLKSNKDEEIGSLVDQLMIQEDKQKVLNSEIRALTDQLKVSEEGQQLLNSEIQMLNNRENDTKNQLKLSKEKENWLEARISMLEKESEEAKHLIVQLDLCKDEQELLTQKILKFDKDENNLRIQLKKFEEDDKLLKYRIKELDDKNDELENKLEAYREYIKEARESFDRGMFLLKKGSAAEIEKFQKGNTIPYELGLDLVEKYIKNTHEIAPSMLYSVLKVVKSKNPKKIEKLAELLKEKELVSDNYRNARLNINLLRENAAFDVPSYYLPISDEARNFIINFLSAQESNGTVGYLINSGKLLAATVAYLLLSGNNPGPGSIAKS